MADQPNSSLPAAPSLIAGRYRGIATLGRGGTAVVYNVIDTVSGQQVALKQLLETEGVTNYSDVIKYFEYEFYFLAQLAHPRVIEVYSYGTDDIRPYYTMELLDGGDIRELSPLPWKEACSLMIDVCSALGLLHSRRQVHRDLTPLNIRCTRDGKAKLIDFGAMVTMGPCKHVIGTPAFTAPEVVGLQSLDARTDLYSLGTTFYYALTGHPAFAAKTFSELPDLWALKPPPPSTYISDIPAEMDRLILSLISVDPLARPSNAAEVMEKLSVIAGREVDDRLFASKAYLSTPVLVGRDAEIAKVKAVIANALRGRGSAIVVEGGSGVGRTRLLDAIVLEGKFAGVVVLRTDAVDAYVGDWGAVRALSSQLLELAPDIALEQVEPYLSVLAHILPELVERYEDKLAGRLPPTPAMAQYPLSGEDPPAVERVSELWGQGNSWRPPPMERKSTIPPETFRNPQQLRPRVQGAMRDWLLSVGKRRPLIIAVDDIHRIDEPSAACIALLAKEVTHKMTLVAVTVQTDAPSVSPAAIKLLRESGDTLELKPLGIEDTERLLQSMFGQTPNVQLLANRLDALCQGNPRGVMQLTRHLVDKGVIRYRAAAWSVPGAIDASDLPSEMSEAMRVLIDNLSPDARTMAQMMALSEERSFSYSECVSLTEDLDAARFIKALDELVVIEIFSSDGQYYSLSHPGWSAALIGTLDKESKRAFHLRLAGMFERRGNRALHAAKHFMSAGQELRALDVFIDDFERKNQDPSQNRMLALDSILNDVLSFPPDWVTALESLLTLCEKYQRPKKHHYYLHSALVTYNALTALADRSHYLKVIEQLRRDSGLDDYHELGDSVEPGDRLWRALELAQKRFDESPPSERVLAPDAAIRTLAQTIVAAISYVGSSFDYALIESLPSLQPFVPLSGALDIVDKNVQSTRDIIGGLTERSRLGYLAVLERLYQPDHGGLDDEFYDGTRLNILYAVALTEAHRGCESALKRIEEFEAQPLFQVSGWRVRMIYYLGQGDTLKALQCKEKLELLQIQNSPLQFFEGSHVYTEMILYASSDDLAGVQQTIDTIQKMAKRFRGWIPILHYARAQYQRIRGDFPSAASELEEGLKMATPGHHILWPYLAACTITTLVELGRVAEAVERGRQWVEAGEEVTFDITFNFVTRALAWAEAKSGEYESAIARLELVIREFEAAGITGINLGRMYETRARIAVLMGDHASFKHFAECCYGQYKVGHNPALTAKYDKLIQEAKHAKVGVTDDLARAAWITDILSRTSSGEGSTNDGKSPDGRLQRLLEMLVNDSNSAGGFLYLMRDKGPLLSAQSGPLTPSVGLGSLARDYVLAEIGGDERLTTASEEEKDAADDNAWKGDQGEAYRPVLLGHYTLEGYAITGLALLLKDASKPFVFPADAVAAISKSLLDTGEVCKVCTKG